MVKFKSKLPSMIIACLMALVIMVSAVTPAFAAGTASVGSVAGDVDGGTIIGQDVDQGKQTEYDEFEVTGSITSNADVYVTVPESDIMVTVPKVVILDGKSGASNVGEYTVKVQGDIAAETVINVVPQDEMDDRDGVNFEMSSVGKDNIPTDVEQAKTSFTYADGVRADAAASTTGTVTAYGMTAGQWNGDFAFNISTGSSDANLIVASEMETGYYDKSGVLKTSSTYIHTDFIPVEYGATYQVSYTACSPVVVLFDENYQFVSSYYDTQPRYQNLNKYITISDENVAYMVINTAVADQYYVYAYKVSESSVPEYTTTIGFLGDSITAGGGRFNGKSSTTGFSYARLLGPMAEANTKIYAQNDACVAGSENISIVNQVNNMTGDLDMIVIMGGVNDYQKTDTADFGTISDTSTDTFYGALNVLFTTLTEKFEGKPIVYLTPLETLYNLDGAANPTTGKVLDDYVSAIKEVAALYDNVTIIDTHTWSEANFDCEDTSLYGDKIHPTQEGHALLADYVYEQLKALGLV